MATFKDINQLSQKSAVAGTEKIPVSNTEYITPAQIAALVEGRFAIVDFDWEDPPTFSDISDLYDNGILPIIRSGLTFYFPSYIDSTSEECSFFDAGHGGPGDPGYISCIDFDGSEWSGVTKTVYSKPSGGIPASDLASAVQTSLGKADSALQSYTETDPVFAASAAHGISSSDISAWNAKQKAITVSSSEPTSSQGSDGDIWIKLSS